MDKNKAIELLKGQKAKLDHLPADDVWKSQTASLIKEIIGKGSEEYHWVSFVFFLRRSVIPETREKQDRDNKNQAIQFINGCIETIGRKGVYQELEPFTHKTDVAQQKPNILQRLNNSQAIGILVTVSIFLLGAAVLGGKEWGKYISDTQNFELRQENAAIKKENETLRKQTAALEGQIKESKKD